jgi:hypothetical protein
MGLATLRRVDRVQADPHHARVETHVDGIAVRDADHDPVEDGLPLGLRARGARQQEHQHKNGATEHRRMVRDLS